MKSLIVCTRLGVCIRVNIKKYTGKGMVIGYDDHKEKRSRGFV